jgi:hypothetical protein
MRRADHHKITGMPSLAIVLGLWLPVAVAQPAIEADFAGRWVGRSEALTLRLPQQLSARMHDLRIFAGAVDITALLRFPQPGVVVIESRAAPLAPGESELTVYLGGAHWTELARFPLKVLTATGFEEASFAPKLDLGNKSQFDSRATGTGTPPLRPTFADLTGRGGASWQARRGAFAIDGNFNAVGSSYRNEALRFGEMGELAPKTDLAEYVVNTRYGGTSIAAGHLSTGSNALLLNSFGSRGVTLGQRFGQRFDVALHTLNGTSIVGYDNFFGLEEADHRVYAATAGFEFFAARPGALRAEISLLDASVQSRNNFNVGEVTDAEQSRGFGLRFSGRSAGNRVRGDAVFARSRFVNPFDPQLAQGGTSQAVRRNTANGRIVDLAFDLVQASPRLSARHPLTLTLALHHERVAPLYKSLGAFFGADQQLNRAMLTTQIGAAQWQVAASRREDNLDNVATVLKNRTDTTALDMLLPLPQWTAGDSGKSWWPAIKYSGQLVHQRAINAPAVEASGIAATHRPDQKNTNHQFGLDIAREPWTWGYALSYSEQDNRQVGRENADFSTLGQQVNLGVRAWGALSLSLGLSRNRNHSREKDLATYTTGGTASVDWQLADRWTLAANFSHTRGTDSADLATSRNNAAQGQLAYRFEVPSFGRRLPGQIFVRYARQSSTSRESTFALAAEGAQWVWDAGLALSFF